MAADWPSRLNARRGVLRGPPESQMAVQALGVGIGIAALANAGPVIRGLLPPFLDRVAAGLRWLWFVNLFTFMDGIDGVEAGSLGIGLVLVGAVAAWRGWGGDRGEPVAWQAASRAL